MNSSAPPPPTKRGFAKSTISAIATNKVRKAIATAAALGTPLSQSFSTKPRKVNTRMVVHTMMPTGIESTSKTLPEK